MKYNAPRTSAATNLAIMLVLTMVLPMFATVTIAQAPGAEPGSRADAPYLAPSASDVASDPHVARFTVDRSWGLEGTVFSARANPSPADSVSSLAWTVDGEAIPGGQVAAWTATPPGLHYLALEVHWNDGSSDRAMTPLWVEAPSLAQVQQEVDERTWNPTGFEWIPTASTRDQGAPVDAAVDTLEHLAGAVQDRPIVLLFGDFLDEDDLAGITLANPESLPYLPHYKSGFGTFLASRGDKTALGEPLTFVGHALAKSLSEAGFQVLFVGAIDQQTGALERDAIRNGLDYAELSAKSAFQNGVQVAIWGLPSSIHLPANVQNSLRPAFHFADTPMLDARGDPRSSNTWQNQDELAQLGVTSVLEEVWRTGFQFGGTNEKDLADVLKAKKDSLSPGLRALVESYLADLAFDEDLQKAVRNLGDAGVAFIAPADECATIPGQFMTMVGINDIPGVVTVAAGDRAGTNIDSCLGPSRRAAIHGTGIDFVASPSPFDSDYTDAAGAISVTGAPSMDRSATMMDNSMGASLRVAQAFATLRQSVHTASRPWHAQELMGVLALRAEPMESAPWTRGVGYLDSDDLAPAPLPSVFSRGDQIQFSPYDAWLGEATGFLQYVVVGRPQVVAALNAQPEQWSLNTEQQWRLFMHEQGQALELVDDHTGPHFRVQVRETDVTKARDTNGNELDDIAIVTLGLAAVPTQKVAPGADDPTATLGQATGESNPPSPWLLPGMYAGDITISTPNAASLRLPLSISVGTALDVHRFVAPDTPVPGTAVCLATPLNLKDLHEVRSTMMEINDHNVCAHWADTDAAGIARFHASLPLSYDIVPFFSPYFEEKTKDVSTPDASVSGGATNTMGPRAYPQRPDSIALTAPRGDLWQLAIETPSVDWQELLTTGVNVDPSEYQEIPLPMFQIDPNNLRLPEVSYPLPLVDPRLPSQDTSETPELLPTYPLVYYGIERSYPLATAVHWRYLDNMEGDHFASIPASITPSTVASLHQLPNPLYGLYGTPIPGLDGGLQTASPDRLPLALGTAQDTLKGSTGNDPPTALFARPGQTALPMRTGPAADSCDLGAGHGASASTVRNLLYSGNSAAHIDALLAAGTTDGIPDQLVLRMEPSNAAVLGLQPTLPACSKMYTFNVPQPNEETVMTHEFDAHLEAAILVVCIEVTEAECRIIVPTSDGDGVYILEKKPTDLPRDVSDRMFEDRNSTPVATSGTTIPGLSDPALGDTVSLSRSGHVLMQSRQRSHDRDHGFITYTIIPFGLTSSGFLDPLLAHLASIDALSDIRFDGSSSIGQASALDLVREAAEDQMLPLAYAQLDRPALALDAWGYRDSFVHEPLADSQDLPRVDASDANLAGERWAAADAYLAPIHPNVDRARFARGIAYWDTETQTPDVDAMSSAGYAWIQPEFFEANVQVWDDDKILDTAPGRLEVRSADGAMLVASEACARDLPSNALRCLDVLEEGTGWTSKADGSGAYDPNLGSTIIRPRDTGFVDGTASGWQADWAKHLATPLFATATNYATAVAANPAVDANALEWFAPATVRVDRSYLSDMHQDTSFLLGTHHRTCEERHSDSQVPWNLESTPRWMTTCPWTSTGSNRWDQEIGTADTANDNLLWGSNNGGWTTLETGTNVTWTRDGVRCQTAPWETFTASTTASQRIAAIEAYYAARGATVHNVSAFQDPLPTGTNCGDTNGWHYQLEATMDFHGPRQALWNDMGRTVHPLWHPGTFAVDLDNWIACKGGRPVNGAACNTNHPIEQAWSALAGTNHATTYQDETGTHALVVDGKALAMTVFGLGKGTPMTYKLDGTTHTLTTRDDRLQHVATVPVDYDPDSWFSSSGTHSEFEAFYRTQWMSGADDAELLEALRDVVALFAKNVRDHLEANPYWTNVAGQKVPHPAAAADSFRFDAGDLSALGHMGHEGRSVGAKDAAITSSQIYGRWNPDHLVRDETGTVQTTKTTTADGETCWIDPSTDHDTAPHLEREISHTLPWNGGPAGTLHNETRNGATGATPPTRVGLWCTNEYGQTVPARTERETLPMRLADTPRSNTPITPFLASRSITPAAPGLGLQGFDVRPLIEQTLLEIAGAADSIPRTDLNPVPVTAIKITPLNSSSQETPLGASPILPLAHIEIDADLALAGLVLAHEYDLPTGTHAQFMAQQGTGPWQPLAARAAPGFAGDSEGSRLAFLDVTHLAPQFQLATQLVGDDWANATWNIHRIMPTPVTSNGDPIRVAAYQGDLSTAPFLSDLTLTQLEFHTGPILLDQDLVIPAGDERTFTGVDFVASDCGGRTCTLQVQGILHLINATLAPAAGLNGFPVHVTGTLQGTGVRAQGLAAGIEVRGGTLDLADCWIVRPGHLGILAAHATVRVRHCAFADQTLGILATGSDVRIHNTLFDRMLRSAAILHDSHGLVRDNTVTEARQSGFSVTGLSGASDMLLWNNRITDTAVGIALEAVEDRIQTPNPFTPTTPAAARDRVQENTINAATTIRTGTFANPTQGNNTLLAALTAPGTSGGQTQALSHNGTPWQPTDIAALAATIAADGMIPASDVDLAAPADANVRLDIHTAATVQQVRLQGTFYNTSVDLPEATTLDALITALQALNTTDRTGLLGTPGRIATVEVQNPNGEATHNFQFTTGTESRVLWTVTHVDTGSGWQEAPAEQTKAASIHNTLQWPLVTQYAYLVRDLTFDTLDDLLVTAQNRSAATLHPGNLAGLPHTLLPDGTLAVHGNTSLIALGTDLEPGIRYEFATRTSTGQIDNQGLSSERLVKLPDVPEGVTIHIQGRAVDPTGTTGPWTGSRILVDRTRPVLELNAGCLSGSDAGIYYRSYDPRGNWGTDPAYRASGIAELQVLATGAISNQTYPLLNPTFNDQQNLWTLPPEAYVDGESYSIQGHIIDHAGHAAIASIQNVVVDTSGPRLLGLGSTEGLLPDPNSTTPSYLGTKDLAPDGSLQVQFLVDDRPIDAERTHNCGIEEATLEYRVSGAGIWRPLDHQSPTIGTATTVLTGTINSTVVQSVLGRHLEFRVWAKDRAGHQTENTTGRIIVDTEAPLPLNIHAGDFLCLGPNNNQPIEWGAKDWKPSGSASAYEPSGIKQARLIMVHLNRTMEVLATIHHTANELNLESHQFDALTRDQIAKTFLVVDAQDRAGNGMQYTPAYLQGLGATHFEALRQASYKIHFDNDAPQIRVNSNFNYGVGLWENYPNTHIPLPTNGQLPNKDLAFLYDLVEPAETCFVDQFRIHISDEGNYNQLANHTQNINDWSHAMQVKVPLLPSLVGNITAHIQVWDQANNTATKTVNLGDPDPNPPLLSPTLGPQGVCYRSGYGQFGYAMSDNQSPHYLNLREREQGLGGIWSLAQNNTIVDWSGDFPRIAAFHTPSGASRDVFYALRGADTAGNIATTNNSWGRASIDADAPELEWLQPTTTGFFDPTNGLQAQWQATDAALLHCNGVVSGSIHLTSPLGTTTAWNGSLSDTGLGAQAPPGEPFTLSHAELATYEGMPITFNGTVVDHAGWSTEQTIGPFIPDDTAPVIDPLPTLPLYTGPNGFLLAWTPIDPIPGPGRAASGIASSHAIASNGDPIFGGQTQAESGQPLMPPTTRSGATVNVSVQAIDNVTHETTYNLGSVQTDFDVPGYELIPKTTICSGPQTGPINVTYSGWDTGSGLDDLRLLRVLSNLAVEPVHSTTEPHYAPEWSENATIDPWQWGEDIYLLLVDGYDMVQNGEHWTQVQLQNMPEEERNILLSGATLVVVDRRHPLGNPLPGLDGFFREVGNNIQAMGEAIGYRPIIAAGQLVSGGCEAITFELFLQTTDGSDTEPIQTQSGNQTLTIHETIHLNDTKYTRFHGQEVQLVLHGQDGAGHTWTNHSSAFVIDLVAPAIQDPPSLPALIGAAGINQTWTALDDQGAVDTGITWNAIELRPDANSTPLITAGPGTLLDIPAELENQALQAYVRVLDGAANELEIYLGQVEGDRTAPLLDANSINYESGTVGIDYTLAERNPSHILVQRTSTSGTSNETWTHASRYEDTTPPTNELATYTLCPVDQAGNPGTCQVLEIFVNAELPSIGLLSPSFAGTTRLGSGDLGLPVSGHVASVSTPGTTIWSSETDPGVFTLALEITPPHPDATMDIQATSRLGPISFTSVGSNRYEATIDLDEDQQEEVTLLVTANNGRSTAWRHSFHFAKDGIQPQVAQMQPQGNAHNYYNGYGPDGTSQKLGYTYGGSLHTPLAAHSALLTVTQWSNPGTNPGSTEFLALEGDEGDIAHLRYASNTLTLTVGNQSIAIGNITLKSQWYRFDLIAADGRMEAFLDETYLGSLPLSGPIRLESTRVQSASAMWTAPKVSLLDSDLRNLLEDQPILGGDGWQPIGQGTLQDTNTLGTAGGPTYLSIQPDSGHTLAAKSPPVDLPSSSHLTFRIKAKPAIEDPVFTVRNDDGDMMVRARVRYSTLEVEEGNGNWTILSSVDSRWHRFDIFIRHGHALIQRDQLSSVWVPLHADGPAATVEAGGGANTVDIDRLRIDMDTSRHDHTFVQPLTAFGWSETGSGLKTYAGSGFLGNGYLQVTGATSPGGRTYASFPTTGLGSKYTVEAAFAIGDSLNKPEHQAILSGLKSDDAPRWAVTLGPSQEIDCDAGDWRVHLYNGNTRISEGGVCLKNEKEWHFVRVEVTSTSVAVTLDDDTNSTFTSSITTGSDKRIGVGDVFPSPDAGRSGRGVGWYDDVVAFKRQ